KDFQHKTSKMLVDYCIENNIGKVVIGDINVKKVIEVKYEKNLDGTAYKDENGKRKRIYKGQINGESKSISVSRFKTYLTYKLNNVGIETILQNEAYTSKINCLSNKIEFDSGLDNRYFDYVYENKYIKIDRDINSGINILTKSGIYLTQEQKFVLLNNKIEKMNCY